VSRDPSDGVPNTATVAPTPTGRVRTSLKRRDVDDVALGHETKMRWNPAGEWVYSAARAHDALVDEETVERVQTMIAAGARRPGVERKPRRSKRSYAFSGLLFCGLCERRMIGSFNNDRNHDRCTYSSENADANRLAHPRSLYLREDKNVELVDPWVQRAFSGANLRTTLQAMADAQHDDTDQHRIIAAREKIHTCRPNSTAIGPRSTPEPTRPWSSDGSPRFKPSKPSLKPTYDGSPDVAS